MTSSKRKQLPLPHGGYAESLSMEFANNAHFYNRNTPSKHDFDSTDERVGFSERVNSIAGAEIFAIGCSFTFGTAVKREFAWPNLVEVVTGKKVANLGMPGSAIGYQVAHVLKVLRSIGPGSKPQKIYGLFPEIQRYFGISEREDGRPGFWPRDIPYHEHAYAICTDVIMRGEDRIPVFRDYEVKDLRGNKYFLAPETAAWTNLLLLDSLIAACALASIDFTFSSWQYADQETFSNLRYVSYKIPRLGVSDLIQNRSQASDKTYKWIAANHAHGPRPWQQFGVQSQIGCDHEPQSKEQEECWDIALDGSHPGLHDHIHFAEFFTEKQLGNNILEEL